MNTHEAKGLLNDIIAQFKSEEPNIQPKCLLMEQITL